MDIQIATWNVKMMLKSGKMYEIGLQKEKEEGHAQNGEMR
jgi:hypothetical protein